MQQLSALETVEGWHSAVNGGDYEQLCAVTSRDVELVGSRGSVRGHEILRHWLGRASYTAVPLRWFLGRCGDVVVEQRGRWSTTEVTSERVVASAFRVVKGRVVRYQRFDALGDALATCSLSDDDEVLYCA